MSPVSNRRRPPTHSRRDALRLGIGGLGALTAALLVGCADDDDDGTDVDATRSLLAPDPTLEPGVASGVLRLGAIGEPRLPRALVYATLVAVDPRGARVHGDLATSVELADPLEVTFQLSEHASFHRGTTADAEPITALEVVRDFSIRAAAGEFLFAQVVEEVTAPEPLTVRMRLRAPFALLFEQLGDPDAAGIRADAPSSLGVPLGSGPFVPERREDGGISLLAHPGYHQLGLPALDEVRIITADRERALDAAFENRALDIRSLDSTESIARASERPDATQISRASRRARGLGLSLVGSKDGRSVRFEPAFQDQRVRRALSLALDREALAAFDGSMLAGPIGPGHAADALPPDDLAGHPLYRHDPAEGAKLLQAAGLTLLAFSLEAPRTQPMRGLAQLIVRQLRDAGMAPQLELVDDERLQQDLDGGDFETILFELEPIRAPDIGLRLHASGGLTGVFSPWGYSNPIYDEAVRDALLEIDPAERARAARAAQRLLLDDVPALVSLPEPVERIAIANAVGGYEYDAYEYNERGLAPRWHLGGGAGGARPPLPLGPATASIEG